MNKSTLAILTVAIISSAVATQTIQLGIAQTKPAIPEFTVKFEDNSYDAPATYSIDPYTGTKVTHPSHRVDNKTIELKIKNQPFVQYNDDGGLTFYYNVRVKGHYAENWINIYSPAVRPLTPSNSDYTVLSFLLTLSPSAPDQGYTLYTDSYSNILTGLPSNAQIDFQVEALRGYLSRTVIFASWHFTGEESGWSNTQTITINESTSSPTQSPTEPTPSETPLPTTSPSDNPSQYPTPGYSLPTPTLSPTPTQDNTPTTTPTTTTPNQTNTQNTQQNETYTIIIGVLVAVIAVLVTTMAGLAIKNKKTKRNKP